MATEAAPTLAFSVDEVDVLDYAATPTLRFVVRIEVVGGGAVRAVGLNTQLRIAATRRRYADAERERLTELFGLPEQWTRSLRSLHWANVAVQVPAFEDATQVELPVPCTYDLEVIASRYFDSLTDGDVPIELLFGGTVFYAREGRLQVRPIDWSAEAEVRMPVAIWRATMDRHFSDSAWLRLRHDAFGRLHAYRAQHALPSWEDTVEALLREAGEP